jgi:hypothetical protein
MPVLVGMVGLAIDMGRMYIAQTKLQAAVDAAALAGSATLPKDVDVNNGKVSASVNEYLNRNYPQASRKSLTPGTDIRSICVSAEVNVPMTFMAALGINSRPVSASACAGYNDLEVALVLDNSGSMYGNPITNVKNAANQLVNLMMPQGTAPSIMVGLVPFRGKVRINDGDDGQAAGCRNADGTVNDSDITWHNGGSSWPDWSCRDNALPPIKALTNNKGQITDAINSMKAYGGSQGSSYASGTIIVGGIRWGRELLTPDWPYTQAGPQTQKRKILILLTDGHNEDGTCPGGGDSDPRTNDDSPYRRNAYYQMGDENCHCNDYGCLDQEMLSEAQRAKEEFGIEIFVIRYGTSSTASDIAIMKTVASSTPGTDDHYFDAPSNSDIPKVFEKIGRALGFRLL